MFERPDAGERAVLVHLNLQIGQEDLEELKELTKSAGAEPVAVVTGSRYKPDPKYFVGSGKLEEIRRRFQFGHRRHPSPVRLAGGAHQQQSRRKFSGPHDRYGGKRQTAKDA